MEGGPDVAWSGDVQHSPHPFLPTDPHSWTPEDVCQWVQEVKSTQKRQNYFSKVKESRYKNFRGEMLCNLRKDIFLAFESGFAGEHLFEDLQRRIRSESTVSCGVLRTVCADGPGRMEGP